ncbi:MAG: ethylbenzene dehydrogenase-related protein [Alphaproteobacteria bacterium]
MRRLTTLVAASVVVAGQMLAEPSAAAEPLTQPLAGTPEVAIIGADRLVVVRVPELKADDPYAIQWWQAPYVEVDVVPQEMAMPTLEEASVERVRLQTLHDGRRIAWRVSWEDQTLDGNVDVNRFSDAVALEFPLDDGAAPMMGDEESRVQILHWKALWQKDIDEGFQDVQDLHPSFWSDLYWFAKGRFPYPVPEAFDNPAARQWFPALRAGNPMATWKRRQPVEELLAQGWGTLTHQPYVVTAAKGTWLREQWAVVFTRPLETDDPLDHQFAPGATGQIAVAVWDGSTGNVGARKHWSDWVAFEVEP